MPWVKDIKSQKPRVVYTAPPEGYPMLRIIYDPTVTPAAGRWSVVYAHFHNPTDTVPFIESLMGL